VTTLITINDTKNFTIWNAGDRNANSIMMPFGQHKILTEEQIDKVTDFIYTL
jgi:sulfur-oxidizing protein SoxX